MKGIVFRKAQVIHEDERRKLIGIMNGELSVKNIKIIQVKKGEQLLGNHWHEYPEVMYMIKGKAKYKMQNKYTGETEEFNLKEGDIIFRTGHITHAGIFEEDSVILDAAGESYISADFNDVQDKIW